jgi:GntR family transcriptional regulator
MLIRLDEDDSRALHEQVASALRRAIAAGEVEDRLPPARELAVALGINVNTVLRALRDLRDEGLLEFRRGRGIRVADGAAKDAVLIERVRDLVREAERHGFRRADLIKMIEEAP